MILSLVHQQTLLNCRLVNKPIGELATARAFCHVRLFSGEDGKRFVNIARSETLRACVREVTCDTYVGDDYQYHCNENFTFPWKFLAALPFLRYFERLQILNLRFSEYCAMSGEDDGGTSIEEPPDLRYRILDTVFHCIEGSWSVESQHKVDEELGLPELDDSEESYERELEFFRDDYQGLAAPIHDPPSSLSMTVSNLADFDDPRLTKSEAFAQVMATQVSELKILFAFQQVDSAPENARYLEEKYELMEQLPDTWLMPQLAANLTVLSLYCRDYWGWTPRMDFRWVNPGTGPDAGFPNLRVLALGNYIFSHEWQIDWIASLGRQNGRGGLEELYLDDSPILYKANAVVRISDDMYQQRDWVASDAGDNVKIRYPLRWHRILPRWRDEMKGLRIFRMGHGAWWDCGLVDHALAEDRELLSEDKNGLFAYRDFGFMWYDRPTTNPESEDYWEQHERYRDGQGLCQERKYLCQYIEYDIGVGPSPWMERIDDFKLVGQTDSILDLGPTETFFEEDGEALASLIEVVDRRRTGRTTETS
ncbi:hypothetical protein GQ53DRAFT_680174 [Thozetella sp. PMI_491]|nr:hypothetical protein GQ53DRAFT_680174 [Thozetella sp. PMI_491]